MASTARSTVRRLLGVLIAGAVAIPPHLAATAPQGILPFGINDRRQIVGEYVDAGNVPHGFLLDKHGRYIRLDFPGARSSQPLDINDRGQVAGEYQDAAGTFHGYAWESGRFRTIDLPGQTMASASGINNRGQLTGRTGPLETSPAPIPNAQIATT